MNRNKLLSTLRNFKGSLRHSIDKRFDGDDYDFVAQFDTLGDCDDFIDDTGARGSQDLLDGIVTLWFDLS